MTVLSVVIPARNAETTLPGTLRSIESTLADLPVEILVVDDHSSDRTPIVAKKHAPTGMALHVMGSAGSGVADARNTGLARACGEWVLFLDADDRLRPSAQYLTEILPALDADLAWWAWERVAPTESPATLLDAPPAVKVLSGKETLRARLNGNARFWIGATAFYRPFIEAQHIRFTSGCASGEDMEFTYFCLIHAQRTAHIAAKITDWVQTAGSASRSANVARFGSIQALLRVEELLARSPDPGLAWAARRFRRAKIVDNLAFTLRSVHSYNQTQSTSEILDRTELMFPGMFASAMFDPSSPARTLGVWLSLWRRSPIIAASMASHLSAVNAMRPRPCC